MLTAIFNALGGKLLDSLFGNIRGALKDFQERKISEAEFKLKLQEALLLSAREMEVSHAELTAKTFESFQQTLRTSTLMQTAWCWLVYTELFVLFWHQFVIPFLVMVVRLWSPTWTYPSSGSTVEWSYALLAFLFGAGAMLLRSGPGAGGGVIGTLKSMVGLK
jgi:hypothetical protein